MRNCNTIVAVLAAVVFHYGCAGVQTAYQTHVKGPWYMDQGKYAEGLEAFGRQLAADPANPVAAYWMGRYHLALSRPDTATPLLEQAVRLAPNNAEAHYWLAVSYWAQGRWDLERTEHQKVLALDPDHLGANLYLGHNHLDRGEWNAALAQYDRVLQHHPAQAEALFNRAKTLSHLSRKTEEIQAWKTFLDRYPEGAMALAAADHLNALGDFDYRNVRVGKRRVTIGRVVFDAHNQVTAGQASLDLIAALLANNTEVALHIVVYADARPQTAKARSLAVQRAIIAAAPGLNPGRLPLSWFGVPEKVKTGTKVWRLEESVQFVTDVQANR